MFLPHLRQGLCAPSTRENFVRRKPPDKAFAQYEEKTKREVLTSECLRPTILIIKQTLPCPPFRPFLSERSKYLRVKNFRQWRKNFRGHLPFLINTYAPNTPISAPRPFRSHPKRMLFCSIKGENPKSRDIRPLVSTFQNIFITVSSPPPRSLCDESPPIMLTSSKCETINPRPFMSVPLRPTTAIYSHTLFHLPSDFPNKISSSNWKKTNLRSLTSE